MNGCKSKAFQSSEHKFWWGDTDIDAVEFHTGAKINNTIESVESN